MLRICHEGFRFQTSLPFFPFRGVLKMQPASALAGAGQGEGRVPPLRALKRALAGVKNEDNLD